MTRTLTTEMHTLLERTLIDALTSDDAVGRAGAPLYLATLANTPIGYPLGDLEDVINYFVLEP